MDVELTTPVHHLPLIGPQRRELLSHLGIQTVRDLLFHIPFRYDDFTVTTPINQIEVGETVTIIGTIEKTTSFVTKSGKRIVEAKIVDATGKLSAVWFNQYFLLKLLREGLEVSLSGQVTFFGTKRVISNPQYEILTNANAETLHTGRLVAIYNETEGLTSKWLRGKIHPLLEHVQLLFPEYLPEALRLQEHFPLLPNAVYAIHFPESIQEAQLARKRLAFDELLAVQIMAMTKKKEWVDNHVSKPIQSPQKLRDQILERLPFTLTDEQQVVVSEMLTDLSLKTPMNRLLVGDVGSGKTVVAAIGMFICYSQGFSSVLMAPTQILAEQHYQTIQKLLSPLGIEVDLVTGGRKTIDGKEGNSLFHENKPKLVIGTHALLNIVESLPKLGLVVIDEQHRFGVKQRLTLVSEQHGLTPHLLTMTATPIPRTIAKTLFGSQDVSILSKAPKGRQTIKTWLVPNSKRKNAYEWMKKEILETKSQIFIICPLIDYSETLSTVKAVTEEYANLKTIFKGLNVGLLHGRMKPAEKTAILDDFRTKKYHILLATPVVEVGIDIPNATVIVIEAADRFGLGQLHQLRGRVGRGDKQSYCLLFTENADEGSQNRLRALETIHSGPELAELDLKLRGAGDLFGTRQHGLPILKLATFSDLPLIERSRMAAEALLASQKTLSDIPYLRDLIKNDTIEEPID